MYLVVDLRKGKKGERKAGAKYTDRKWDAKAQRWVYVYDLADPHGGPPPEPRQLPMDLKAAYKAPEPKPKRAPARRRAVPRGLTLLSETWRQLRNSSPASWTKEALAPATNDELEALSRLMGIPYTGTKPERIARLLDMASLRVELSTWPAIDGASHEETHARVAEVAQRYKRPQLVALSKRADLFTSTTKHGLVIGLLQWREQSRRRGQEFQAQLKQATRQASMDMSAPPPAPVKKKRPKK